jgi:5'-nucleotidase
MNVLIVNDDGPDALGLQILQEAALQVFRHDAVKVVTLTCEKPMCGSSLSTSSNGGQKLALEKTEPRVTCNPPYTGPMYVVPGATPADLVYQAFCFADRFLPPGRAFDLVLSGVNHGHNVGMDILHSGTVGAALLAATYFQACGWAFSQEMYEGIIDPTDDHEAFKSAKRYLAAAMQQNQVMPGTCLNFNFPKAAAAPGFKSAPAAPYSRWYQLPNLPKPKPTLNNDVEALKQGFVVISELELKINPSLRY